MTPCPVEDALRAYLRGAVSNAEQKSLADHLNGCTACLERLSRLDESLDPLLGALRGVSTLTTPVEPAVLALLERDPAGEATRWTRPAPLGAGGPGVEVGERVGPYLLLAKLGEGGMGAVYKARHERLGKVFALKVQPPAWRDAARATRFEREMKAVGRLEHP